MKRYYPKDYYLGWLALLLMGLFFRPLTPIDETRAVSVAWEMWLRHDFWVPHLNGQAYSHKPPLLQWCIQLFWALFGVNPWSARLVAPLFALGNLILTASLAKRLWQDKPDIQAMAPWVLLAMPLWSLWTSLTLYDMLVTFFTLLGLNGILIAARGEAVKGWLWTGLAIGGGLLSKGPAILIFILPAALLAPFWIETPFNKTRWYCGVFSALLMGAAIGLAWAIPAGISGGEAYQHAIFWGQSAGRITNSFAHKKPFGWYFLILPAILFPWSLDLNVWRSVSFKFKDWDLGLRFCAIQFSIGLMIFSFISGKQPYYLLPLFPAFALFSARILDPKPKRLDLAIIGFLIIGLGLVLLALPFLKQHLAGAAHDIFDIAENIDLSAKLIWLTAGLSLFFWQTAHPRHIAWAMISVMFAAHLIFNRAALPLYDMQPIADHLNLAENSGQPIAYWGKYSGEFTFLGRLKQSLPEIHGKPELIDWMEKHKEAYVVLVYLPKQGLLDRSAEFTQYFRGQHRVGLWKASTLLAEPQTLNLLITDTVN